MHQKTVRTWMTPIPITIGPNESVLAAYEIMKSHHIRRLPVVDTSDLPGTGLIGIITITDIRKLAPLGGISILEKNDMIARTKVKRVMTADPVTISADENIGQAAWLMMKHQISGLPVLENGALVGVISEADLFRLMFAENWQPHPLSTTEPGGHETVVLAGGEIVHIRPIRPDDAARLQASHVRMSPETIYDRFMSYKKELPDDEARYLSAVDYDRHMALVASIDQYGEENLVGVARYHVLDTAPDSAEFAIVIGDPYQHMGLGTHLFRRLIEYAQAHGIRTLIGITHRQNIRLLRFVQRSGLPIERTLQGDLYEVRLTLEGEPYKIAAPDEFVLSG
ncbi:MAG TPA: GNAT family N-acetyltransferase [Anaerolineales bacterium]|nr:GNAT family N-acetyltransferase [Anaerolineales bacterium]